jgi:NAD(P)-dependent dehydrogenase (short-subunit alcohol dehydrogenase family)
VSGDSERVALVTGASRGLGRASALALAEAGYHVVAVSRAQKALESLDDEILARTGKNASLVPLDLKDGPALDRLGGVIFERWKKLDAFLANAGVLGGGLSPVPHYAPRAFEEVIATNLTANARLIRALDPLLRESPAGRAVFVTSGRGVHPKAYWGPYAASKAGLESLVLCYADEIRHSNLKVNLLDPGRLRTLMREQAYPGEDATTLPLPEAITPLIVEMLSPNYAEHGARIDGGAWLRAKLD